MKRSLFSTYTIDLFTRNDFIKSLILEAERKKSDNLLLNILPETVANELKEKGTTTPVRYSLVTVLFVDFVGFTRISANLSPDKLIQELSENFCYFDTITRIFSLEKIKTIGDSYMLAGGIPQSNDTHHFDCLLAALRIKKYLNYFKSKRTAEGLPAWDFRMGINTGPLIAGVIGEMKFAYDIFGDTVNVASRMESHGEIGEINVSQSTYELIADYFDCEYRGKIDLKGRGLADMYLVKGIRSEFAADSRRFEPNEAFLRRTGCRFNLEPAVNYDTTKI
jgi:class 3 adenylate cyclase